MRELSSGAGFVISWPVSRDPPRLTALPQLRRGADLDPDRPPAREPAAPAVAHHTTPGPSLRRARPPAAAARVWQQAAYVAGAWAYMAPFLWVSPFLMAPPLWISVLAQPPEGDGTSGGGAT